MARRKMSHVIDELYAALFGLGGEAGDFRRDRRPPPAGGAADGGQGRWLTGLLKGLGLEDLDRGDILLLLILLLLLTDGDDLEPVITLGLLLLFSLGGREDGEKA